MVDTEVSIVCQEADILLDLKTENLCYAANIVLSPAVEFVYILHATWIKALSLNSLYIIIYLFAV